MIVDHANPLFGDTPYTLQLGECEDPAEYIHFTPDYLTNIDSPSYFNRYGLPGMQKFNQSNCKFSSQVNSVIFIILFISLIKQSGLR